MNIHNWIKTGSIAAAATIAFVSTAPVAEAGPRHRVHKAKVAKVHHHHVESVERSGSRDNGTAEREKVVTLKNGETVTKQTTVERNDDGRTTTQTVTNRKGETKTRTTTVVRD